MAEEAEAGAAELVAAGPRREMDDAAVEAPELGRRAVALDAELGDLLDDRQERDLPRLGLQHRDAVEDVLVGARTPAVDPRERRRRRTRHARRQHRQVDEVAPVQRQRLDARPGNHLPQRGRLRLQPGGAAGNDDRLAQPAELQLDVDAQPLAAVQIESLPDHAPEAGELDHEPVRARLQAREAVGARDVRHGHLTEPGRHVRQRNDGAGNRLRLWIRHAADELGPNLAGGGRRERRPDGRGEQQPAAPRQQTARAPLPRHHPSARSQTTQCKGWRTAGRINQRVLGRLASALDALARIALQLATLPGPAASRRRWARCWFGSPAPGVSGRSVAARAGARG